MTFAHQSHEAPARKPFGWLFMGEQGKGARGRKGAAVADPQDRAGAAWVRAVRDAKLPRLEISEARAEELHDLALSTSARDCEACGAEILRPRAVRYCSHHCARWCAQRALYARQRAARQYPDCRWCGVQLQRLGAQQCTARACQLAAIRIAPVPRPCEVCGTEHARRADAIACSPTCADKLAEARRKARRQAARAARTCALCGAPYRSNDTRKRHCSARCRRKTYHASYYQRRKAATREAQ